MKKIAITLGLFASFAVYGQVSSAHAQTAYATASTFDDLVHRPVGWHHTVAFGKNGSALRTTPNTDLIPGGGWHRAGSAALWADPLTGGFTDSRKTSIPISGKTSLPVVLNSPITKSAVVASFMRCLGHPMCVAVTTVGASALGVWLEQSNMRVGEQGDVEGSSASFSDEFGYSCNPSWVVYNTPQYFSPACTATESCTKYGGAISNNGGYPICRKNGVGYFVSKNGPNISGSPVFTKLTEQQIADRLNASAPSPAVVSELLAAGQSIERESPKIRPSQPSVEGEKVVKTEQEPKAGGGTQTRETTKTTHYDIEETEQGIKVTPREVTTVKIDGVPQPDLTTTEEGKPNEQELQVCGLPNTPACKIDEDGTPEAVEDTHKKDVDDAIAPMVRISENPASFWPQLPEIRWDFRLPTGCAAIAIPAFAPYLQEIDICQFMPTFHDIMGIVWLMGGLLGAVSIFWRNTFAK